LIVPQQNLTLNELFIVTDKDGSDVSACGTIHCSPEAPDAQRVVNTIAIDRDKDYDLVVRVTVAQVYAAKGLPLGVLVAALGMPIWDQVVSTVARFGRLEEKQVEGLLHSAEMHAAECLQKYSDRPPAARGWACIAEHVSSKQQRAREGSEPLPQHPTDTRVTTAYQAIHQHLLPHVHDSMPHELQAPDDFWSYCRVKAQTLCALTADVLRVFIGVDQPTDRDRMENKRFATPGELMHKLFRAFLRPQLSDFRTQLMAMDKNKKPIDIRAAMSSERLHKGLAGGLQNGKFHLSKRGARQNSGGTAGVSQVVTRYNQDASISHLRKVTQSGTRKTPANARQLHTSQWGYVLTFFPFFFCVVSFFCLRMIVFYVHRRRPRDSSVESSSIWPCCVI
jgi:DNA-directed RNA polymerase beta subunit